MRSAPFLPMPGTLVSATMSDPLIAARIRSGGMTESMARASRGPTPETVCTCSNMSRSSVLAKP